MAEEKYRGKVAFITGGASGIGKALAQKLGAYGSVVHIADREGEAAQKVAQNIIDCGGEAYVTTLDVTNYTEMEKAIHRTIEVSGKIDYLFNNAGIAVGGPAANHTLDDWNYALDVNLKGVIHGIQSAYPIMKQQGFGHIINTASLAGLVAVGSITYCTTKHALVGLSKALRVEAESLGINVSVLCPGVIDTPLLSGGKHGRYVGNGTGSKEKMRAFFEKMNPMNPDLFAEKALKEIEKNRAIILLPKKNLFLWLMERLFPEQSLKMATRFHQKTVKRYS